jgi:hypothetical protein
MCNEKNNYPEKKCPGITIDINVAEIVKYLCIAGVLIIGIIFGSKCIHSIFKIPRKAEN